MKSSKKILWLSLVGNISDAGLNDLVHWADERGIKIEPIRHLPPISEQQFAEVLTRADGYLLTFEDAITHNPFERLLISEIRKGKRLVAIGPNPEFNRFLLEFDLGITTDRLCGSGALFGDDRTVLLRQADQTSPTAQALMGGNEITVSTPSRVWYGPAANPIFSLPEDSRLLNEGDCFEDAGPRALCCGGLWTGDDTRAGVLVLAGSGLHDPYQGVTGKFFPGIRANLGFAQRLLDWLVGDLVPDVSSGRAIELLHSIEVGLYDLIVHMLKQHFQESPMAWWYEGIPEPLRKKAAELSEDSKGRIPKEQGFYFLSYKTIIEGNWKLFAAHFDAANQGKNEALRWLLGINELRNRLSHPLRLREAPLNQSDFSEIERRKNFVQALCRKVLPKPE